MEEDKEENEKETTKRKPSRASKQSTSETEDEEDQEMIEAQIIFNNITPGIYFKVNCVVMFYFVCFFTDRFMYIDPAHMEEFLSNENYGSLSRLSPVPTENDYLFNLYETEGASDLFDIPMKVNG